MGYNLTHQQYLSVFVGKQDTSKSHMGFTVGSHSNDTLRYALFSDTHKWQCFKTESCSLKDNQIHSPCGTLSLSWPEWFLLRVTLHPCFTTVSIKMFEISPPLERAYIFGIGTLSREFSSLSVGFNIRFSKLQRRA